MVAIKILSVGAERTTPKGTSLVDIEVLKLDTKETIKVACFLGSNGTRDSIDISADYEADITNKPYKGKPQYSTALWTMKKIEKPEPEEEKEVDWDSKERRGHRRACLAIASSLLTDEQKSHLGAPDVEVTNMVQMMAVKLIEFVYEDVNEITNEPPF